MFNDQDFIDRTFAQFKRHIDVTGPDGRVADFHLREDEGLGNNVLRLSLFLPAAQTAKYTGRDWWGYSNNGSSHTQSVDFLTTSAPEKPNGDWIPSIYGNSRIGSNSVTPGDYTATLSPKFLPDQRT